MTVTDQSDSVETNPYATPRVLSFNVSFHVQPGLASNIRMKRVEAAIAGFEGLVKGAAASLFPWANRVQIDTTYDYRWLSERGELTALPPTAENGG